MVMEATPSPSPQSVGREFVRQYYTLLNKAPAHLHRFYNNYSSFVHGGLDAPHRETLPVVGQKQIHNRIQQLNFRDCHAKISQVDSQATLGSGVVVQVTGELSNAGAPMRRFTQTFVLAAQSPKKYYVHNDIFRYQDLVPEDDEPAPEPDDDEPAGYFPAPPAFPPAFPAPPRVSPPLLAAHLNGHPALALPDPAAEPPAPAQEPRPHAAVIVANEMEVEAEVAPPAPEPAPEPEPAREPSPPPAPAPPPQPAVPAEPKTYANLLKSGAPHAPAHAPAPAPAPAYAHEPRPRPQRAPRDQPTDGVSGRGERSEREGARRYSDSQQLFLGNVPPSATEEELRALFARFGPVAELRVLGRAPHPHYGFVTYESARSAQECLGAAPLYFPADSPDGVKLNVEEKKTRGAGAGAAGAGGARGAGGGEAPRRRPNSTHRAFPPRQPYRR